MTTLVLDTPDTTLSISSGILRSSHPDLGVKSFPWSDIKQIIISKDIHLTSNVILALADKDISLVVSGHRMRDHAVVMPLLAPTSKIKLQQYSVFTNASIKDKWSKQLITKRVEQQERTLKALNLPKPASWNSMVNGLKLSNNVMLSEAILAQHYWAQWCLLFFPGFCFNGRSRQPPMDPINAILSLSSTLEDSLYCRQLLSQGLDIGLGFHHSTGYRRHSLIYDVKELTRSKIEYWVAHLFISKYLTADDFTKKDSGVCVLSITGKPKFYRAWHTFVKTHLIAIKKVSKLTRKLIEREARINETLMDY